MKKGLIILSLLLVIALMFTACGSSSGTSQSQKEDVNKTIIENGAETSQNVNTETTKTEIEDTKKSISGVSRLEKISDFADLWNNLYKENERYINDYDGMPIMALVVPGTCFITGVQYELLNMDDKDGCFKGELMFAGYDGFIEKNGSNLTFGYDDVLEKDGFSPNMKAGDRKVEAGTCDLKKVYYFSESYTERNGKKIERMVSEFRQEKDGSISCFVQSGRSLNSRGEEAKYNEVIFIRNGKDDLYDFVVAKGEIGPDFEIISLKDRDDMTKDKAINIFQDAGYVLDKSGGIVDGKLTLDAKK